MITNIKIAKRVKLFFSSASPDVSLDDKKSCFLKFGRIDVKLYSSNSIFFINKLIIKMKQQSILMLKMVGHLYGKLKNYFSRKDAKTAKERHLMVFFANFAAWRETISNYFTSGLD
jgi:hypothetical protein